MIERVTSYGEIHQFISDPAYLSMTAQDGEKPKCSVNPNHIFLTDCSRSAFVVFIPSSPICVRIHGNGKPIGNKARSFFAECIEWAWECLPISRIETTVAFRFPSTKNFLLNQGFQIEGVAKNSFKKQGRLYDSWLMGMV